MSCGSSAKPGDCPPLAPLTPEAVPLTRVTVQSTNATSCATVDLTPGTYERVESHFKFDFNISCTIHGNVPTSTGSRCMRLNYDVYGTQNTSGYLKGITHSVSLSPGPFSGLSSAPSVTPESTLAVLNDVDPNGTWRLYLRLNTNCTAAPEEAAVTSQGYKPFDVTHVSRCEVCAVDRRLTRPKPAFSRSHLFQIILDKSSRMTFTYLQ